MHGHLEIVGKKARHAPAITRTGISLQGLLRNEKGYELNVCTQSWKVECEAAFNFGVLLLHLTDGGKLYKCTNVLLGPKSKRAPQQ
eukprot:scaffold163637_cov15-Tisochrysis_lutea.AAC.1